MKILLVEDDIEISDMLKNFLITENFEVVQSFDGESACQEFFADDYSLVLLDLMIPKKSGMEVMKISIPEQDIFVWGEKGAIDRILSNLITNALRYGSDGKYIGLFLRESREHVYIDIVDKGKGIEKEFAGNVFERLYTMEDSRNRRIQGNGLGLTIAKNLACQLGGDISLESEPNVKTSFTVKLKK